MSAEAILDALAAKAATVTGIKEAYGSGASSSSVATMTSDIPDTPVALVLWDGFEVLQHGDWERLTQRYVIRVYVNNADVGAAYKELAPFGERFVVAFRTDADLGGTCQVARIMGADRPAPEDLNGKPYLVLTIHVEADEARVASYTV